MIITTRVPFAACVVAALVLTTPHAAAGDTLAQARELYAAAAYTDALTVLDKLLAAAPPAGERQSIELYRILCLAALGRSADADRAAEAVIAKDPLYRPAGDVSPRIRALFGDARKRLLPSIVQQKYAEAKAAYDRKEFAAAAAGFKAVLDAIADPDIGQAAAQPPLSDIRTLADGFHDLSADAAAPPPTPAAPPQPERPVPGRIYAGGEPNVVPPVVIRQRIPPFRGKITTAAEGVVEVVIDARGAVESARMVVPLHGMYDGLVVSAARAWQYRPATLNGVPVRFRNLIRVTLKPSPPEP